MSLQAGRGLTVQEVNAGIDKVVELAIQAKTLTSDSPFYGWSLRRFRAPGPHHTSMVPGRPLGPMPKSTEVDDERPLDNF